MQPLPSSMLNPFIYLGEEFEALRTCCHPLNLSLGKRVDSVASTSRGGQPEAEGAGHGQHVPGQDRTDPASPIVLSPHTAAASVTVLSRETGCCFTGIKM